MQKQKFGLAYLFNLKTGKVQGRLRAMEGCHLKKGKKDSPKRVNHPISITECVTVIIFFFSTKTYVHFKMTHLSVLLVISKLDLVDLLVDLRTVMVALLTSTSNSVLDTGRMPGSDTSNLAQTLVSLARQLLRVPS